MRKHRVEVIHLSHGDGRCQVRLDHDHLFAPYVDIKELPNYVELHDRIIALPLHPGIGAAEAERVAIALKVSLAAIGATGTSIGPPPSALCSHCVK
jgi:hypothetical protein